MTTPGPIRNIGPISRRWLHAVEVYNIDDLRLAGAVSTYRLIKEQYPQATLNLLWALEAAIQDVDWRELGDERKAALRASL